ncbi:MAG: glycosyltransferase [candidate division KSB1 bacterium]|nr:glycosyltransferase [candidate division KSB1 bacterium]
MDRIRVLYLIDILCISGGTEINLFRLLSNLDKDRFDIIVCPLYPQDSPMIQMMRENDIQVEPILVPKIYDLNAIRQSIKLRRLIQDNCIDIVQTIHLSSDFFGSIVARWAGVKAIISSRRDMGFQETRRRHWLMRRFSNYFADLILTNSKIMQREIICKEHVSSNKISMVYNGLDPCQFTKTVNKKKKVLELGLHEDKFIITVISNIRPIKGLEFFIEAASKVTKNCPNVQFIIVGGDAIAADQLVGYKQKLVQLIRQLNLENKVFFLGSQSEVAEILAITDVYVQPSLSEGFSNTILEAMAAGKPVVATDVGGNPEAVLHEITGLIVPPKDSEAIANAVITLLEDKELAMRLGQSARTRIETEFSIDRMTRQMEELYISLAKKISN